MKTMTSTHVELTLDFINQRRTLQDTLKLDGQNLSIPEVLAVSDRPDIKVAITEDALDEVLINEKYLKKKLDEGLVVYGINTGFGGHASVRYWNLEDVQRNLVFSLNVGMGRVFPTNYTRAAMVTRANCLSKAYSGVRPLVPSLLVDLINHDIIPQVPLRGSVSASGDLMPLSYIAATMNGTEQIQVVKQGTLMSCPEALKEAGVTPIVFGPKEGLAVINAVSFAAGVASPTLYDANLILLLTQVCTGMSVEALHGRTESFHPMVQSCLPHIGQKEIAENMLTILKGSKLAITKLDMHLPDKYGVLKQDRYSLRSASQWLGPVAETLNDACRRLKIELNSANDNPLIDHRTDVIAHGANFQGETLSITMDQTRQVIGVCGKLLFAQFSEVVNGKLNFGLPPNLSGLDINVDSGFKGCDTAMASYMSELDHFVNPMSNHVLSAETHNQSVNSMALVSTRLTVEAIEIIQMMVANILCLTAQAVDLRHIRNLVLAEMAVLCKEHPEISESLKAIEWYDLLFLNKEKASELSKKASIKAQLAIQENVANRLSDLYKSLCNGKIDTSSHLGQGTSKMYKFIRHELKIPFYSGQNAIGVWLEQIFTAIKTRKIEDVLHDIFS